MQQAQNVCLWNQCLVVGVLVHTACDQDVTDIGKEIVLDDLVATPEASTVLAILGATPVIRRLATTIKSMLEDVMNLYRRQGFVFDLVRVQVLARRVD
jgi:hypothetical protein